MWIQNSGNINFTEIVPEVKKIVDENSEYMSINETEVLINDISGDIEDITDAIAKVAGDKVISGYIDYYGDYDGSYIWDEVDKKFWRYDHDDAINHVATWHDERKGYLDRYRVAIRNYFSSKLGSEDRITKYYVLREMEFVLDYAFDVSANECKRIYGEEYANMYFRKENANVSCDDVG